MTTVTYKFDLDQMVKTPFGTTGFITFFGYDEDGPQYSVITASNKNWYKEKQLSALEEDPA